MDNLMIAAAAPNVAAEKGGAWFEYSTGGKTFSVKIKRSGTSNPAYMTLQNKLMKPWRNIGRGEGIPHEQDREIMRKLASQTLVVDWNPEQFGKPFSVEECHHVMTQVNDFLDWVNTTAQDGDNFRRQQLEEAEKN